MGRERAGQFWTALERGEAACSSAAEPEAGDQEAGAMYARRRRVSHSDVVTVVRRVNDARSPSARSAADGHDKRLDPDMLHHGAPTLLEGDGKRKGPGG